MAKAVALIAALCLLALAGSAQANKADFVIKGDVYCDTCKVLFFTKISTKLAATSVNLRCRNRLTTERTYESTAMTNEDGTYTLPVKGEHADDICEVSVGISHVPGCQSIAAEISTGRVPITSNSGIESHIRYANPIGFVAEEALPECAKVLDDLGFVPEI
ncbi:anther-specific protein LAT52-like [Actinidia eriantha]|uniref:anther-specific protein LAT52-like n=1 Tax=Actinidia eriantha TaxID=165200 RepID=UPI00258363DA|nr:anther-specific protein LAT52-like [Actinidia eriantha]